MATTAAITATVSWQINSYSNKPNLYADVIDARLITPTEREFTLSHLVSISEFFEDNERVARFYSDGASIIKQLETLSNPLDAVQTLEGARDLLSSKIKVDIESVETSLRRATKIQQDISEALGSLRFTVGSKIPMVEHDDRETYCQEYYDGLVETYEVRPYTPIEPHSLDDVLTSVQKLSDTLVMDQENNTQGWCEFLYESIGVLEEVQRINKSGIAELEKEIEAAKESAEESQEIGVSVALTNTGGTLVSIEPVALLRLRTGGTARDVRMRRRHSRDNLVLQRKTSLVMEITPDDSFNGQEQVEVIKKQFSEAGTSGRLLMMSSAGYVFGTSEFAVQASQQRTERRYENLRNWEETNWWEFDLDLW